MSEAKSAEDFLNRAKEELAKFKATPSIRHNDGKAKLHYILSFPRSLEALARILEYGEEKYEYLNYLKGGKPDQEYFDSMMRHILEASQVMFDGDEEHLYDKESMCMHMACVIFNAMAYIDLNRKHLPTSREDVAPF